MFYETNIQILNFNFPFLAKLSFFCLSIEIDLKFFSIKNLLKRNFSKLKSKYKFFILFRIFSSTSALNICRDTLLCIISPKHNSVSLKSKIRKSENQCVSVNNMCVSPKP